MAPGAHEPEPPAPPPSAVGALLSSRRQDARPAFVEGSTGRSLTWSELAARADRWGDPALRLRPGGRVGLAVSDPLEMVVAFLGAVAGGFTVAPLNPAGTASELVGQAGALGLGAVVTGAGDAGPARGPLRAAGIELWEAGPAGVELAARRTGAGHPQPGRGVALVLATSGTTGRPKLIPLTEAQLLHTARAVVGHHALTSEDRGYSPLPLYHINGLVVGVLAALAGGHRLVVDRRFSASSFWEVVGREEVTWLNLVPAIIHVLGSRPAPPRRVRARVRFARSASAALPAAYLERFEQVTGIPVVETYGMTEAASQITANPLPPGEARPGSVGLPVGLEVRVVGGGHGPLPAGTVGEVQIRGESVVHAYWEPAGRADADRPARTDDGWLPTGDLGRLDEDGYLYLAGRADDVINRGGEKLYPRELEEVLLADPQVTAAAVVGRPHPTLGEEPVAFVVPAPGSDLDALRARLWARLDERLSAARRPADVVVVDAIPSGPNGKVRHAELRRAVVAEAGVDA